MLRKVQTKQLFSALALVENTGPPAALSGKTWGDEEEEDEDEEDEDEDEEDEEARRPRSSAREERTLQCSDYCNNCC